MTTEEFSNEFDTLVASYRRFKAFDDREVLDSIDFNEYEKSVYLTKAQSQLVQELYSGKYTSDSFERTEDVRRYLEHLVVTKKYSKEEKQDETSTIEDNFIHTTYNLPDKLWYIVFEKVSWDTDSQCLNRLTVDVKPVQHDEYNRISKNPFRGPNSKRVLRLDNADQQVELVSTLGIKQYMIRYLTAPEPIVLAELTDESIDGVQTMQTCQLPDSTHKRILEMAVGMAINSKLTGQSNSKQTNK